MQAFVIILVILFIMMMGYRIIDEKLSPNIENIVPFNISDEIIVKYNKFFTNYKFMENIQITKHMYLNILYDKKFLK